MGHQLSLPQRETITRGGRETTVFRDPETGQFRSAFGYTFAWHALSDACPKCANLNGREWTDQDLFQEVLWDMIWGNVWNLDANHSMAHGEHQYNCRCQLEVRVDVHVEEIEGYGDVDDLLGMFR